MFRWQTYIVHPLTALFFGVGSALFVHHYQLLNFAYAPILVCIFLTLGYWLLSRKYDPILTVIFFLGSVFVIYHGATLTTPTPTAKDIQKQIHNKLFVAAALVEQYQIDHKKLPQSLDDISFDVLKTQNTQFSYCTSTDCQNTLKTAHVPDYAIIMHTQDKHGSKTSWFIDNRLQIKELGDE